MVEDEIKIKTDLLADVIYILHELEYPMEEIGYKGYPEYFCKICYSKFHDDNCKLNNVINQLENINGREG